ncbi:MAG: FecR domain-containing protein [Parabacteroides sp.]|nr:FecR domain-containing protein [Parabacteroides sp.]MDD4404515.1 FecR domain-containing protein [Parabacteroides sp.]
MIKDKNILNKLLNDDLSLNEKDELNTSKSFSSMLEKQWTNTQDVIYKDETNAERIWSRIRGEVWDNNQTKRFLYFKLYSIAATILLVLGISSMICILTQKPYSSTMFVVYSGIQNIKSIGLPDGSSVQLGPGSKLTYPSQFSGKKREVLLEGQAFFDVHKDGDHPFVVKTKDMDVTALGTAFEVYSYNLNNNVEAILLNGKIQINTQIENMKGEVVLLPNEKLTYSRVTRKMIIEKVDASKYSDWRKHGILSFENEKLSMIIPRLEQWYGRKVMCEKDIADKYRFTFKVRDESLERILYILNSSSPVKYKKVGENFELFLKN